MVVNLCNDGVIDADQVCLGSPPRAYTIGLDPIALRVADFDDDGDLDLLCGTASRAPQRSQIAVDGERADTVCELT